MTTGLGFLRPLEFTPAQSVTDAYDHHTRRYRPIHCHACRHVHEELLAACEPSSVRVRAALTAFTVSDEERAWLGEGR